MLDAEPVDFIVGDCVETFDGVAMAIEDRLAFVVDGIINHIM